MDIYDFSEEVKTKEDFELFLKMFKKDLLENKDQWENNSLESFLDALSAYAVSIDGYYKNMNISFDRDKPTWRVFADILLGAKIYE